MGVILPLLVGTIFWLLVGAVGPFLAPKGVNRGIFCLPFFNKLVKMKENLSK